MTETTVVSSFSGYISYYCRFPSCKNVFYSHAPVGFKQKKFFRFPRDPIRAAAWKEVCHISPAKSALNYYVCSEHFSLSDYSNPKEPSRLNFQAVPKYIPTNFHLSDHCYTRNYFNEETTSHFSNSNVAVEINNKFSSTFSSTIHDHCYFSEEQYSSHNHIIPEASPPDSVKITASQNSSINYHIEMNQDTTEVPTCSKKTNSDNPVSSANSSTVLQF